MAKKIIKDIFIGLCFLLVAVSLAFMLWYVMYPDNTQFLMALNISLFFANVFYSIYAFNFRSFSKKEYVLILIGFIVFVGIDFIMVVEYFSLNWFFMLFMSILLAPIAVFLTMILLIPAVLTFVAFFNYLYAYERNKKKGAIVQ